MSLDYKLTFGPPKTKRGQRQVPLDAATITGLRAHRKRQAEERLAIGAGWTDTGLVFTRADGYPVHPDSFAQAFERHLKASGQPKARFHDLRRFRPIEDAGWRSDGIRESRRAGPPGRIRP